MQLAVGGHADRQRGPERDPGRDRASPARASGRPAASSAASQASASSRWVCASASAARPTTSRQRWRGSTAARGVSMTRGGEVGSCTSGSLPDDGRARPDHRRRARPRSSPAPRPLLGRPAAPTPVRRPGLAAGRSRASRRSRRGSPSSSARRSSSACCSGWPATASARSSSACSLVYLLDPPVRWLVRARRAPDARHRRSSTSWPSSRLFEFLNLTLTPLINELLRFIDDFPQLAAQLQDQLQRLAELYARLQIPDAIRDWIDARHRRHRRGRRRARPSTSSLLLPLVTGAGSLIGAVFGYIILPVWVFYLLKDRVALTGQFDDGPARRPGGSTCGPCCGSSSACSASGSAASSSWASRSGS